MPAGGRDVLVVGGGPAGLAAAAACVATGLDVGLLTADPDAPWTQTYGAWLDELVAAGAEGVVAHQWADTRVRTGAGDARPLGRTYCLIDNGRLRSTLRSHAEGMTVTTGRAASLEPRAGHLTVTTTDGTHLSARAVVDATGQPPVFAGRRGGPLAYQTAYGMVATFDRPPIAAGTACLMDLDAQPFGGAAPPTFLYAMDLGDGRWFVEETCLARRPALPLAVLEQRLRRRLAARGAEPRRVLAVERCAFPMDPPLPSRGPAIAFGAAAAMVHPATGYHVATALRRAPELAEALRAALAQGEGERSEPVGGDLEGEGERSEPVGGDLEGEGERSEPVGGDLEGEGERSEPVGGDLEGEGERSEPVGGDLEGEGERSAVASAASEVVWPAALRRQHALYRVGLEVLLRLDVPATQRFFEAFFDLPAACWRGYVSRTASPAQIEVTMLRLMWALPWDVRRTVLRAVAQRPARRWLARATTPWLTGR